MVLTTYGTTSWKVLICNTVSGSGYTAVPPSGASDTIVYIKCEEVPIDKGYQVEIKTRNLGQNRATPNKKKCQQIDIDGIIKNIDLAGVVDWLDARHAAADAVYAFVYFPNNSGSYDLFPFTNSSFTKCSFLKCHVTDLKYILKAGKIYGIQMKVKEVS